MDYNKLVKEITFIISQSLHYYEHDNGYCSSRTSEEVDFKIYGGIPRYKIDPIYRAKVDMLVSRIMNATRVNNDSLD